MKFRISIFLAALAMLVLIFPSCTEKVPLIGELENYTPVKGTVVGTIMSTKEYLSPSDYSPISVEGAWLAGCTSPDRDDIFDAYVLSHESTKDGNTTFTYLIYYPHEGTTMNVTPALLEDGDDYVVRLVYTEGKKAKDASLSYVSVILPEGTSVELSLIFDGDELGILNTVTQIPVSCP